MDEFPQFPLGADLLASAYRSNLNTLESFSRTRNMVIQHMWIWRVRELKNCKERSCLRSGWTVVTLATVSQCSTWSYGIYFWIRGYQKHILHLKKYSLKQSSKCWKIQWPRGYLSGQEKNTWWQTKITNDKSTFTDFSVDMEVQEFNGIEMG